MSPHGLAWAAMDVQESTVAAPHSIANTVDLVKEKQRRVNDDREHENVLMKRTRFVKVASETARTLEPTLGISTSFQRSPWSVMTTFCRKGSFSVPISTRPPLTKKYVALTVKSCYEENDEKG